MHILLVARSRKETFNSSGSSVTTFAREFQTTDHELSSRDPECQLSLLQPRHCPRSFQMRNPGKCDCSSFKQISPAYDETHKEFMLVIRGLGTTYIGRACPTIVSKTRVFPKTFRIDENNGRSLPFPQELMLSSACYQFRFHYSRTILTPVLGDPQAAFHSTFQVASQAAFQLAF